MSLDLSEASKETGGLRGNTYAALKEFVAHFADRIWGPRHEATRGGG